MPGLLVSSKDHHFIAVNRAGDMRSDSLLCQEIHVNVDGLPDLVSDLHKLDQAFWPGKPDPDINIAAAPGFSSGIRPEDSDPLSAIAGQDSNYKITDLLLQGASSYLTRSLVWFLIRSIRLSGHHLFAGNDCFEDVILRDPGLWILQGVTFCPRLNLPNSGWFWQKERTRIDAGRTKMRITDPFF
jgi:hypothetical protein